jgi:hypothetical protein
MSNMDPRVLLVVFLVSVGGYYGGKVVHWFHRTEAPHCREFKATRPPDEAVITGTAHYCQFDEVDGSIGFTAEACGCK